MVGGDHRRLICPECGWSTEDVVKTMADWDKCEQCGAACAFNPDYTPSSMPSVRIPGGATFAPPKSPAQVKNEKAKQRRREKQAVLAGKGSVVEKDAKIQAMIVEDRADEVLNGAIEIEVPRTLDAELKPDIPLKYSSGAIVNNPLADKKAS